MDENLSAVVAAEAAAEHAAEAAELAADVAAVAAASPEPDPNVLVHAEVDLARLETETELAKIAAREHVKIAEIQQEEPAWLLRLWDCLARLEATIAAMVTAPQSIPPASAVAIVETDPAPATAPAVVESVPASEEAMPVQPEAIEPEPPAPAQPQRKSRWI